MPRPYGGGGGGGAADDAEALLEVGAKNRKAVVRADLSFAESPISRVRRRAARPILASRAADIGTGVCVLELIEI